MGARDPADPLHAGEADLMLRRMAEIRAWLHAGRHHRADCGAEAGHPVRLQVRQASLQRDDVVRQQARGRCVGDDAAGPIEDRREIGELVAREIELDAIVGVAFADHFRA